MMYFAPSRRETPFGAGFSEAAFSFEQEPPRTATTARTGTDTRPRLQRIVLLRFPPGTIHRPAPFQIRGDGVRQRPAILRTSRPQPARAADIRMSIGGCTAGTTAVTPGAFGISTNPAPSTDLPFESIKSEVFWLA